MKQIYNIFQNSQPVGFLIGKRFRRTKLIAILSILFLGFILPSCSDFLEQVPKGEIPSIEQVFERRKYSEEFLANIYSYIQENAHRTVNIPWDGLSDDMDVTPQRSNPEQVNKGNWNPSNTPSAWNWYPRYYAGIRAATYFMQHIGGNPELLGTVSGQRLITQYTGEARFLRAYFYYCLLRQYGPVIIIGDEVISPTLERTDAEMNKARNSYEECVQYIIDELNIAQEELPYYNFSDGQPETEWGRATKLMCMAVRSRVLLLAASPQFNEKSNYLYATFKNKDGKQLVDLNYDQTKWEKAAKSAFEIINYATTSGKVGLYRSPENHPYLNCRDVFLEPWNKEVIFCKYSSNFNDYERSCISRVSGGYQATGVTQQLVDEFETKNGLSIKDDPSYSETGFSTAAMEINPKGTIGPAETLAAGVFNMWVNREARFYLNVFFHGRYIINSSDRTVKHSFFYTGNSGKAGTWDFSSTGYVTAKNVHPDVTPVPSKYIARPFLVMRYAEFLLNFAEAANEFGGPNWQLEGRDAYWAINQIRNRAGLPDLPTGLSKEKMRERIRHERRVELCIEFSRYFDTRRWLIAEQTDGDNIYGMNVDVDGDEFFKRTIIEKRVFRKSFYLFPIPQTEINTNVNMVQNPGW